MPSPEPARILLVDDTAANRYAVGRHLKRAGYEVLEAGTAKDGFAALAASPDLIILDVKLPDINGLEVSRMLRSNPDTRHIPILQISATYTLGQNRAAGLDAGADAYLTSPIDPAELLAQVRTLLRLKEAQQALSKTNDRLKSVLSNILDIYIAFDAQLRIVELNPNAEAALGKTSDELVGLALIEIYPHLKNSSILLKIEEAVREKKPVHFEEQSILCEDKWWEGHVYPRDDRVELYLRDISRKKQAEQQLAETAGQLRAHFDELERTHHELAKAQDLLRSQNQVLEDRVRERTAKLQETISDLETFSYSITHDMRAPLRAMQSFSNLLLETRKGKLDPEAVEFLTRIANASNRLDLLIREVLNYSRILRSDFPLVKVDVEKLIANVIQDYPFLYPSEADIKVDSPLPSVLGNEGFLTQCFSNLLGNAVKFVAPGTRPRVEVSAEVYNSTVKFKIRDNGIGIPTAHQAGLFNLFHRAQSEYPGTGIGLAVVRKALERMGGQVGVDSTEGKGSTFWFSLPRAEPNPAKPS